jgi:hypothetical protein
MTRLPVLEASLGQNPGVDQPLSYYSPWWVILWVPESFENPMKSLILTTPKSTRAHYFAYGLWGIHGPGAQLWLLASRGL